VRPINVVHDSSQNIFNADAIFKIQEYYAQNMQKYLWDTHQVNYAFDTLVGKNYYDMCEMRTIEYDKCIELKGSRSSIEKILEELDSINLKYHIDSIIKEKKDAEGNKYEFNCIDENGVINYEEYKYKSPSMFEGFILNDEVYYIDDFSEYVVRITKL
jgi:hypothetical protein